MSLHERVMPMPRRRFTAGAGAGAALVGLVGVGCGEKPVFGRAELSLVRKGRPDSGSYDLTLRANALTERPIHLDFAARDGNLKIKVSFETQNQPVAVTYEVYGPKEIPPRSDMKTVSFPIDFTKEHTLGLTWLDWEIVLISLDNAIFYYDPGKVRFLSPSESKKYIPFPRQPGPSELSA